MKSILDASRKKLSTPIEELINRMRTEAVTLTPDQIKIVFRAQDDMIQQYRGDMVEVQQWATKITEDGVKLATENEEKMKLALRTAQDNFKRIQDEYKR